MATVVAVPLPRSLGSTYAEATRVRDALLFQHGIEVHTSARRGRLWVRVAAQVYNELGDFERLAAAVRTL